MPDQVLEDAGWCMVVFSLRDMREAEEALRDGKLSSYSVSNVNEKGLCQEWCQERQRFLLRELPRGATSSEERPLIVA